MRHPAVAVAAVAVVAIAAAAVGRRRDEDVPRPVAANPSVLTPLHRPRPGLRRPPRTARSTSTTSRLLPASKFRLDQSLRLSLTGREPTYLPFISRRAATASAAAPNETKP